MSVYAAMSAAVSGMKAQSKSLGNISDNLANSQTVGYKRVDTSFSEMVTSSNRRNHSPGGVISTPRYRHSIQGDLTQTQIGTNMAIAGNGFFVVSKANSVTPQNVSFDSNSLYSRRGDFQLDKFGYMVNGGGYYLNGRQVIDQDTLNTSDLLRPIRIQADVMQASATTQVNYSANVPANASAVRNPYVTTSALSAGWDHDGNPATADADQTVITFNRAGSGEFRGGDVVSVEVNGTLYEATINAAAGTGIATATEVQTAVGTLLADISGDLGVDLDGTSAVSATGTYPVTLTLRAAANTFELEVEDAQTIAGVNSLLTMAAAEDDTFYQASGSYSGGAVTVFNELGTPTDVQFRWMRIGSADTSPGAANAQWALMYQDPNRGSWFAVDTDSATAGTQHFTFDGNGVSTVAAVDFSIGPTAAQTITLDFTGLEGQTNLTANYADDIAVYRNEQNGYQAGILSDVFINDYGYVVANYDNGRSRVLYQVPLATFTSPDELERLDGGAFNRTPESGDPLVAVMGVGGSGSIVASATENSNVDIADEFIKMIVAQRAYSANSRSVTTADDMLQEVVNMKR
ncbi:flagellar hook protein FlgE [Novispirillum sp. DQ9]|uniref:flagellar hook protein FlgE n=1 Tax=Novispirillum sp. DQ9 TaxID=3398612 RepID=UPI003C7C9646